jgi:hypothetical protein
VYQRSLIRRSELYTLTLVKEFRFWHVDSSVCSPDVLTGGSSTQRDSTSPTVFLRE